MITRRAFLKGAAVALVLPLPVIGGASETHDVAFTIKAVEVVRSETDFDNVLRVLATSDKPIDGKIRSAFACVKYYPEKFTTKDMVDEITPYLQSYFNDKVKNGGWS